MLTLSNTTYSCIKAITGLYVSLSLSLTHTHTQDISTKLLITCSFSVPETRTFRYNTHPTNGRVQNPLSSCQLNEDIKKSTFPELTQLAKRPCRHTSISGKTFVQGLNEKITATCFLVGHREVMGYAVAQLEEALRYLPEGHAFDSRWAYQDVTDLILPAAFWPCGPLSLKKK